MLRRAIIGVLLDSAIDRALANSAAGIASSPTTVEASPPGSGLDDGGIAGVLRVQAPPTETPRGTQE